MPWALPVGVFDPLPDQSAKVELLATGLLRAQVSDLVASFSVSVVVNRLWACAARKI